MGVDFFDKKPAAEFAAEIATVGTGLSIQYSVSYLVRPEYHTSSSNNYRYDSSCGTGVRPSTSTYFYC